MLAIGISALIVVAAISLASLWQDRGWGRRVHTYAIGIVAFILSAAGIALLCLRIH